MNSTMLCCWVGLLIVAPAGQALAQQPSSDIPVAYTVPVAPWTFPDQPGRGIATEYLKFLFEAAKVPMRIDTQPYARAINGLREGSNVAAMLIPDEERDTFALRLCQVTTIRSGLLYKKARFKKLTLNDLGGLTVGIQRGTHALDLVGQVSKVKQHTIESVAQGLKMLQIDRLDATFLSSPGRDIVLKDNSLKSEDYDWLEIDVSPVVVYISRKAALASDEPALQRLHKVCADSGRPVMDELMRRYR